MQSLLARLTSTLILAQAPSTFARPCGGPRQHTTGPYGRSGSTPGSRTRHPWRRRGAPQSRPVPPGSASLDIPCPTVPGTEERPEQVGRLVIGLCEPMKWAIDRLRLISGRSGWAGGHRKEFIADRSDPRNLWSLAAVRAVAARSGSRGGRRGARACGLARSKRQPAAMDALTASKAQDRRQSRLRDPRSRRPMAVGGTSVAAAAPASCPVQRLAGRSRPAARRPHSGVRVHEPVPPYGAQLAVFRHLASDPSSAPLGWCGS